MNREAFYREIGNIDDDLIQAANDAQGQIHKKNRFYRIAGIAACFCLICGSILFGLQKNTIYINEISAPMASKVIVPADENINIVSMTYQELLAYYGMEQLPDTFGEDLIRTEQTYFVLYQNQDGTVLYDANILYYNSIDRSKTLSITFAKAEEYLDVSNENIRKSKIDGVSMVLATSSKNNNHTVYWATFKLNDVSVKIISDGLSQDEFIDIIKDLI